MKPGVAIIGSGPAGLMAAHVVSSSGYPVTLFEKKSGLGKKLLIAGSSGLNITYDSPLEAFAKHYQAPQSVHFLKILQAFPPEKWLEFIHALGIETFKGTSRRYFVEGMKASKLLQNWTEALKKNGVEILVGRECTDFEIQKSSKILLHFSHGDPFEASAVCFSLGGGSYEPKEVPLRWPTMFTKKALSFAPFEASNVGFQVHWPAKLLAEAEGLPLKNIVLTSPKASRAGDAVITRYGIEGTPVYFAGVTGTVHVDLKPDLTLEQIVTKLTGIRENLSLMRRAKKTLNLCPAALALLFHIGELEKMTGPRECGALANLLKNFPLTLGEKQPLAEAISSSGGLDFSELNSDFGLKKYPGIYAAGEMLNWDAPTGGFWIQGCVSQGFVAGQEIVKYLGSIR